MIMYSLLEFRTPFRELSAVATGFPLHSVGVCVCECVYVACMCVYVCACVRACM